MKTIRQIEMTPVLRREVQNPSQYEEGNVYISSDKSGAFNCLCGCGSFTMIPVNQNTKRQRSYV